MTTFLYSLSQTLSDRLAEVTETVDRAELCADKDRALYNILCRSASVFLVSGLEAFLKDLHEAIQSDLNTHVESFAKMPRGMQREFATKVVYFEGVPDSETNKRSTQLIKFFSANSVNIDMLAFPYKENVNKNPSVNFVDHSFNRYGITSVTHCLRGSKFEAVFDGDRYTNLALQRQIIRMRSTLFHFPYRILPPEYIMSDWERKKGDTPPSSLWQDFLETILRRRHGVVHAETRDNPTSWKSLRTDINKLEAFFAGVMFAASSLLGRDMQSAPEQ